MLDLIEEFPSETNMVNPNNQNLEISNQIKPLPKIKSTLISWHTLKVYPTREAKIW